MTKKIIISVIGIIIVGAAAFILLGKEDPFVTQAKEEVRQAEAKLKAYQNVINAIPALELSQDVKNDFRIESNYLGMIGYIVPGSEPSPKVMVYIGKMMSAAESRGSVRFSFNFDEGFEKILENAAKVSEVVSEDLGVLEKLANVFDVQVDQAKLNVPQLNFTTVERNKKTEKYFLEFDRTQQRIEALTASLDNYSSTDFRKKIKELKVANELFGEIAHYTKLLFQGKSFGYALDVSKVFPEIKSEEAEVKRCIRLISSADCKPSGPFPGGYQQMLQRLEGIYSELLED